jgi:hypothetical protein
VTWVFILYFLIKDCLKKKEPNPELAEGQEGEADADAEANPEAVENPEGEDEENLEPQDISNVGLLPNRIGLLAGKYKPE